MAGVIPLHVKRNHMVSLATLEKVAEACLAEGRVPVIPRRDVRFPGAMRALRFQQGLMLKFLVRVPLRQRNLREMRLEDNLFKDDSSHWQLYFRGSELKIGTRQGVLNEYKVNLTKYFSDFIPVRRMAHRVSPPLAERAGLAAPLSDGARHAVQRLYPA